MFVVSLKASTLKLAAAVAALAVVAAAACWEGSNVSTAAEIPVQGITVSQPVDASTNSGRIAFIINFGWKVSSNPVEDVEIVIPQTFDALYTNYNSIQKSQGYDLSLYKGKRIKRWTYLITNYPGGAEVQIDLLVLGSDVIGGDVSSVAVNGFIQGFAENKTNAATAIKPSQAEIYKAQ